MTDKPKDEIFILFSSHVFWCYLVEDWRNIWHTLVVLYIFLLNYWLYCIADGECFFFYVIWDEVKFSFCASKVQRFWMTWK